MMTSTCPWCNGVLIQTAAPSDARGVSAMCENGHIWDVVAWRFQDDGTPFFELGMLQWPAPLAPEDIEEDHSEPLFMEPVIGYRAWNLQAGKLTALGFSNHQWHAGTNIAICGRGEGHPAPAWDCSCGLYAYHNLRSANTAATVVGAIVAEGALEVHRTGFRAERARIVALADPRAGEPRQYIVEPSWNARRVAFSYGVPLVRVCDLQSVAQEHGSPLPESAYPVLDPKIQPGHVYGHVMAIRHMAGDVWRVRCLNCMAMLTAHMSDIWQGRVLCPCAP